MQSSNLECDARLSIYIRGPEHKRTCVTHKSSKLRIFPNKTTAYITPLPPSP
ncbi:unnamed protein product [Periconia digitata]|uniref:Uncharacterized protein n=1 Tax=Periconia digitata TaxID=1303443 RepID=A0A9W4XGH5_9PLEO|nr:unnamed protein product [Periconia digitata]